MISTLNLRKYRHFACFCFSWNIEDTTPLSFGFHCCFWEVSCWSNWSFLPESLFFSPSGCFWGFPFVFVSCAVTLVCLDMHFYLSCWRFFVLLKSVGWCVSLVLFEIAFTLFLVLSFWSFSLAMARFRPSHCALHVLASSLLAHLLTALPHILDNFTALTFQLTHPLFRLSNLLISLSIELILQRFFYFYRFFFFFPKSSRPIYSFLFLAYVFKVCLKFL